MIPTSEPAIKVIICRLGSRRGADKCDEKEQKARSASNISYSPGKLSSAQKNQVPPISLLPKSLQKSWRSTQFPLLRGGTMTGRKKKMPKKKKKSRNPSPNPHKKISQNKIHKHSNWKFKIYPIPWLPYPAFYPASTLSSPVIFRAKKNNFKTTLLHPVEEQEKPSLT